MNDFTQLGLPQILLDSLTRMNFTTPTPIQAETIPLGLAGRDVLGTAQTGTGKTGAFGIPLVAKLINEPSAVAIVMTPTRELATQVLAAIRQMISPEARIRSALLIGGDSMGKQLDQLRQQPRLIVGTPGRINDHLSRRSLNLNDCAFLVLDETDRMLDMGFGVQIDKILTHMPKERQTLLFSATLPSHITKISSRYQTNPQRVAVGSTTAPSVKITQELVNTTTGEKYAALTQQLEKREGSIIVFVKTKHGADRLARKLDNDDHSAEAIHGDLRQSQRDRVIKSFRDSKHRILVATDVAARGLDVPQVRHVINYDLPQCPEDYIHRIGRTARAGAEGDAVCLLTSEDRAKWRAIERLIDPNAKQDDDRSDRGSNNNRRPGHAKQRFGGHRKGPGSFRPKYEGGGRGRDDNRDDNRGNREGANAAPRERSYGPRPERKEYAPRGDRFENRGPRLERKEYAPRREFKRDDATAPRDFKRDDNRSERPDNRPDNHGNREGMHEKRAYDPRPAHKRHPSDEPRREFKRDDSRGARPDFKKKFDGKKPWVKKDFGNGENKERSYAPRDGQKKFDAPRRDFKPRDGQPARDFKPRSDKPHGDKPRSDKPQGGFDKPRRFNNAA